MPTVRKPKPEPTEIYRALQGFIYRGANGQDVTVQADARLLGSDEAVTRYPSQFIAGTADDASIRQAQYEIKQSAVAAAVRGKR